MRFFKPNKELCQSIVEYAGDRIIVDVGCGAEAELLQALVIAGAKKIIGIDMFLDYHKSYSILRDLTNGEGSIHLFPEEILQCHIAKMLGLNPDRALFLLCRPCHHSDLIDGAIFVSGSAELLYIGLPKNIEQDLGGFDYEPITLAGTSEDGEVILKIKK